MWIDTGRLRDKLSPELSRSAIIGGARYAAARTSSTEAVHSHVLIVISDGADNASRYNLTQVMTMLKDTETIIYTISLFEKRNGR